jgi:hypothetical protein
MQATCDDSNSIRTASVGEPISLELCSLVNHNEPVFLGQSEYQARHIRNSVSAVPQSVYDRTCTLESSQSCCYHNNDSVPTLDAVEDVRSLSVDVSDLTESPCSVASVFKGTKHQKGKNDGTEFQENLNVNVARHLSFKNNQTVESNAKKLCSYLSEGSAVSVKCPAIRREEHTQEPNLQFPTDMVIASDFLGTKEFSHSAADEQLKPPRDQSSQSGAGLQTYGIFSPKIDSCLSADEQANTGISAKNQESQTDSHVLELTISETVTPQNTPKITKDAKCELPRSLLGDVISEACVGNNEVSNVQTEDLRDSQNLSSLQNEHMKESVTDTELSCQYSQTSLSQGFAKLHTGIEHCNGPGINESSSGSDRLDLNVDASLGIVNQNSNTGQLASLLHESLPIQPADVDPKCSFHARLEIERALHLQCSLEYDGSETVAGTALEPSTYVTFVLQQGCPVTNDSELKMATPLASHSVSPVWHWQCDTWLPSDLLTSVSVFVMKHLCGSETALKPWHRVFMF